MSMDWQALWGQLGELERYFLSEIYYRDQYHERKESKLRTHSGRPAREWRWLRAGFRPPHGDLHGNLRDVCESKEALTILFQLEKFGYIETREGGDEIRMLARGRRLLRETGNTTRLDPPRTAVWVERNTPKLKAKSVSVTRLQERIAILESALQALVDDIRSADWYHIDPQVKALIKAAGVKTRHDRE